MSRFYLSSVNSRGNTVTAAGMSNGQDAHLRGWSVGVEVFGKPLTDDLDAFEIYATAGSGGDFSPVLLGTVYRERVGSGPGSLASAPIFAPGLAIHDVRAQREEAAREQEAWEADKVKIRARGLADGRAAGSWVLNGNTTEETARALLRGLEDGDPAVLDVLPSPDFSGQWAGDPSFEDLLSEEGIETHPDGLGDSVLLDEYRDGYAEGVEEEASRSARAIVGEEV